MSANGIYGLSGSGIDVESMVKAGMMAKQSKLDKMMQTYTKNEWKKEAFIDIYKKVEDFNLKKLTDYKLSGTTNSRTATSSDSSLNATANSDAAIGQHYITVTSTASNAYLVGTKNDSWTFDKTTTDPDTNETTTTSTTVSLKKADSTKLGDLGYSNGLSFSINNESISLDSDTTIYGLYSAVNAKSSKTGVKMSYDSTNGYISFYQKNAGSANSISITANDNTTAEFFTRLGLRDRATGVVYDGTKPEGESESNPSFTRGSAVTAKGTNAEVNIDGRTYTADKNSIYADGITYNFGNVTNNTTGKQIVVNVDQDKEKIVENVKSFVDDYNELLDSIYDAYREAPNSSYKPLTDAQKEEMTEDQIKKWEEKAKAGMLYHDQTLRKVIDSVRSAVTSKIEGATGDYDSVYKLGISTVGMYGQLKLNEDTLREALTKDADAVYNVFSKSGNTNNSSGVAIRLSKALNDSSSNIASVSGKNSDVYEESTLNTLLRSMQSRISNFQKSMKTFEDNLYKRYDAMESALASLGSQMGYLSSMMGS